MRVIPSPATAGRGISQALEGHTNKIGLFGSLRIVDRESVSWVPFSATARSLAVCAARDDARFELIAA